MDSHATANKCNSNRPEKPVPINKKYQKKVKKNFDASIYVTQSYKKQGYKGALLVVAIYVYVCVSKCVLFKVIIISCLRLKPFWIGVCR